MYERKAKFVRLYGTDIAPSRIEENAERRMRPGLTNISKDRACTLHGEKSAVYKSTGFGKNRPYS